MRAIYTKETAQAYQAARRADAEIVDLLADALTLNGAGNYLDIGCGSGNYTCALAARAGRWHGIDPSPAMLEAARGKTEKIDWQAAMAETLPFSDNVFDGAVSVLAAHHFSDLAKACAEAARVLKPQTRLILFTATRAQAAGFWLAEYFPKMIRRDAAALPSHEAMLAALRHAGFTKIETQPYAVSADTQDRFFYSGDVTPEIYLSAENRAAMSAFNHAEADELTSGLNSLADDIQSGRLAAIRNAYEQDAGHYTIITAQM